MDDPVESAVSYDNIHLEERKLLIGLAHKASQTFDKAILTLSSGGLAISLTIAKELVVHPTHVYFLKDAWAGFALALTVMTCSSLLSMKAQERQIAINNRYYESEDLSLAKNPLARVVDYCNKSALALFLFGVLSLMLFVWNNYPVDAGYGEATRTKFHHEADGSSHAGEKEKSESFKFSFEHREH